MLGIAQRGAGKLYVKLYETLRETPKIAQNRPKTLRKGQNFTKNFTKLYAEWNSLPFGFFVSYLCISERKGENGKRKTEN